MRICDTGSDVACSINDYMYKSWGRAVGGKGDASEERERDTRGCRKDDRGIRFGQIGL